MPVPELTALHLIGLISDTHGLLRPETTFALGGSERIIHAGDVGSPKVLKGLARLAPVTAVRGNNDRGAYARRLPRSTTVRVGHHSIFVIHDRKELGFDPPAAGVSVVVSGHSHRPGVEERNGVLFVNPGSARPRRFRLPVSVGRLRIDTRSVRAEIVTLVPESERDASKKRSRALNGLFPRG